MSRTRAALRAVTVSALLATALPLAAQTGAPAGPMSEAMNDAQRAQLRAEIRAYLLEHPEVIFEAVAEYERRTMVQQSEMDATLIEINADEIFADGVSWVGGNPEGDITLVEFMDYRCSFCRRAFPEMMRFAAEDGNVRLVIKELPILGPQSEVMSRFAVSVLQLGTPEQYFAAHERLIVWEGDTPDSALQALAVELGLDGEAVLARMRSAEVSAVLAGNRALAQRLQINGTPSFVLGDPEGRSEMLRGFLPASELMSLAGQLRG